jgi:hypothetical protein
MKQRYFLFLIFVVLAKTASAQNNVLDTPSSWISYSQIELYSGQTIDDTVLISISKPTIILGQDGIERSFTIGNTTGTWQNLSSPGQTTFEVTIGDFKGDGTFQRSSSGQFTLTLDFSSARKNGMKRTFTLTARQ